MEKANIILPCQSPQCSTLVFWRKKIYTQLGIFINHNLELKIIWMNSEQLYDQSVQNSNEILAIIAGWELPSDLYGA